MAPRLASLRRNEWRAELLFRDELGEIVPRRNEA